MPLFLQFLCALLLAAACIPPLARWAPKLGLTDAPGPRKVHAAPVPRVGGLAMAIGILVPILISQRLDAQMLGFLAGALTLLVFGLWDDRATLDYRVKFAGQIVAVLLCMSIGHVSIDTVTLDARFSMPGFFGEALTFLFLVGVTNAVNLSDGLDGLAGGMSLLCLCAVALLAAVSGNSVVVAISLIECGAILGFLRFNTHPAQVFMGDSGSQLLGYSIGVLAILATQGDTAVSASLPLLLLGLPILDTLTVMWQRVRAGRSPFSPDRNHLHHKLLALEFSHAEAVALVYLAQVLLFLVAYFLRYESDLMILGVFGAIAVALVAALQWAGVTPWRAHSGHALPFVSALIARLRTPAPVAVTGASTRMMTACMTAYAALAVLGAGAIGADVTLLSLVLLAVLLILALGRGARPAWLERAVAYMAVVLVVYLDQTSPLRDAPWRALAWALVAVIGGTALVSFVWGRARSFAVNSLDLLVVFVAIVVPLLPGPVQIPSVVTIGIAKTVVLLYAVELLSAGEGARRGTHVACGVIFAGIALRGLLAFFG